MSSSDEPRSDDMSAAPEAGGAAADQKPQAADNSKRAKKPKKDGFTFTEDGCRSEIRLGSLLILASVFLWLWLGPATSSLLYFVGLPLVLVGVPIQALQGRRFGRPGYPWKLALALTIGGAAMWPDLAYREVVGGSLQVQPVAPMLLVAGLWMLAWWPVSRPVAEAKGVTA
ncbi:MAG: hypothetical protein PF961_07395 [Planctomycetota bacterium]|jgi:hypothetical protein|nr:hypothetical protein [Planctomycetota bacterium]